MRPTWVEIDLNAIRYNINTTRNIVGKSVSVMAIVKADAYGHGAVEVSKVLSESGVEMFGVASIEEAIELRENEIDKPIVLLGGIQPGEEESVLRNDLITSVYLFSTLDELNKTAKKIGKPCKYHIKFDTGMSRLGFSRSDVDKVLKKITRLNKLELEGVFTHFACADQNDSTYTDYQLKEFQGILNKFETSGRHPDYIHMANSAAIQRFPHSYGNLVRPGIMIYGACSVKGVTVQAAMKMKSRIIQIRELPAGTSVSYGCRFKTKKESRIAVIPVGYADGYMRNLTNKAYVSVKGHMAPVVGTVCMDFSMIDITELNDINIGDEVTLFGDENISIEDVAEWGNTIPYEIMTIVGKRVRKVFI